eukprot:1340196-Amorphochlora_amoeboformis.AAC.1
MPPGRGLPPPRVCLDRRDLPCLRLLLVGDRGVGKTSMMMSYLNRECKIDDKSPTVGNEFQTKLFNINGNLMNVQIWDTGVSRYS